MRGVFLVLGFAVAAISLTIAVRTHEVAGYLFAAAGVALFVWALIAKSFQ